MKTIRQLSVENFEVYKTAVQDHQFLIERGTVSDYNIYTNPDKRIIYINEIEKIIAGETIIRDIQLDSKEKSIITKMDTGIFNILKDISSRIDKNRILVFKLINIIKSFEYFHFEVLNSEYETKGQRLKTIQELPDIYLDSEFLKKLSYIDFNALEILKKLNNSPLYSALEAVVNKGYGVREVSNLCSEILNNMRDDIDRDATYELGEFDGLILTALQISVLGKLSDEDIQALERSDLEVLLNLSSDMYDITVEQLKDLYFCSDDSIRVAKELSDEQLNLLFGIFDDYKNDNSLYLNSDEYDGKYLEKEVYSELTEIDADDYYTMSNDGLFVIFTKITESETNFHYIMTIYDILKSSDDSFIVYPNQEESVLKSLTGYEEFYENQTTDILDLNCELVPYDYYKDKDGEIRVFRFLVKPKLKLIFSDNEGKHYYDYGLLIDGQRDSYGYLILNGDIDLSQFTHLLNPKRVHSFEITDCDLDYIFRKSHKINYDGYILNVEGSEILFDNIDKSLCFLNKKNIIDVSYVNNQYNIENGFPYLNTEEYGSFATSDEKKSVLFLTKYQENNFLDDICCNLYIDIVEFERDNVGNISKDSYGNVNTKPSYIKIPKNQKFYCKLKAC